MIKTNILYYIKIGGKLCKYAKIQRMVYKLERTKT